jgi:tRNA threonylcarbamoyladenosine biosynthesis protein TsaE
MREYKMNIFDEDLISNSLEETNKIALNFSRVLKKGDVVLLVGDLGSGKTTFTKSLVKNLGVSSIVNSPTFKIVNEYYGKFHINHIDLYRLNDVHEIKDIGWDEYINSESVTIVEWADRAKDIWPDKRIEIYFEYIDEYIRKIKIIKKG